MVSGRKALEYFIDNIPGSKLICFHESSGTIYSVWDFHLDMQGVSALMDCE